MIKIVLSAKNKFNISFYLFIFSDFFTDICYTVIIIVLKNWCSISELGAQDVEREKTFKN
jgi:hypothetical protein